MKAWIGLVAYSNFTKAVVNKKVANGISGIRCALCYDQKTVRLAKIKKLKAKCKEVFING